MNSIIYDLYFLLSPLDSSHNRVGYQPQSTCRLIRKVPCTAPRHISRRRFSQYSISTLNPTFFFGNGLCYFKGCQR